MVAYLRNLCLRHACYDCLFAKLPRYGDITLGDLWGKGREHYNHWGVSLVMVNNEAGLRLFRALAAEDTIKSTGCSWEQALRANPRIAHHRMSIPANRNNFLSDMHTRSFQEIRHEYLLNNQWFEYSVFKLKQLVKRVLYCF